MAHASNGRLVLVSNRLPVSIKRKAGKLTFSPSPGGLASGIFSYVEQGKTSANGFDSYCWVGWPGGQLSESEQESARERLKAEYCCWPVFLTDSELQEYYYGFSNKTLWPLFHYFFVYSRFRDSYWETYKEVNVRFCDEVAKILQPGDTVWIHDYHLMLLPAMLRQRFPNQSIGFFLHIPFPGFETFRHLPKTWAREIIEGVLGADVVGFHTFNYSYCFLRCALRITGHDNYMGEVNCNGRVVKVDTFPMGIDYDRFSNASKSAPVIKQTEKLRRRVQTSKMILSIDRLDYTKGILNRLEGYELFLERNPQWLGKVTLVAVVVPSRESVEQYDRMKNQIDETVGRIQGRFGNLNWSPIIYQYRSLSLEPLVAAYAGSDIALLTPLRDGMNLIAKEYVAACSDGHGVLVLSELTGAAEELGEALLINPNHTSEIADSLLEALTMSAEEQKRRLNIMQARLSRYTVTRWAEEFTTAMRTVACRRSTSPTEMLTSESRDAIYAAAAAARYWLVLVDYDGTLVNFKADPMQAVPTPEVYSALNKVITAGNADVAVISGRPRFVLEPWFEHLPVYLIAEHGAGFRSKEGAWSVAVGLRIDWKDQIRPILEMYVDRLPGSFVEEKEYTLVWHYRKANPELAAIRAKELIDSLVHLTATNGDVQVIHGTKIVEIRNTSVHKGIAAANLAQEHGADFILAIGDDWTDEDMFKSLPANAHTIKVGLSPSCAKYRLSTPEAVLDFLNGLGECRNLTVSSTY